MAKKALGDRLLGPFNAISVHLIYLLIRLWIWGTASVVVLFVIYFLYYLINPVAAKAFADFVWLLFVGIYTAVSNWEYIGELFMLVLVFALIPAITAGLNTLDLKLRS